MVDVKASHVVSNVIFNYVGALIASGLGFIATPIILHHIGTRSFGAWALIGSVMSYSSLLDVGVGLTVMRLVAERAHKGDRVALRGIASTGLVIYTCIGLIVLLAAAVAAPVLARSFHLTGPAAPHFETAFMVMAVAIAATFPAGLYTGINQGMGHYLAQNAIVVAQAIAGTGLSVMVVLLGGGLVELATAIAGSAVAGFLAKLVYARRAFGIAPSWRRVERSWVRQILAASGWMFLINIASRVIWNADNIVLGVVLGAVAVAHYAVALGPATAVRRLVEQFNTVSLTAAASLRATGRTDDLARLLSEGTRMAAVVMCPFVLVSMLWGGRFFELWIGPSYHTSSVVLTVLLLGMLGGAFQATATMVLFAFERQRVMWKVAVIEASTNLMLSIALARQMGIVGVAVGTAVPIALTTFLFYLPYAARVVGWSRLALLRRVLSPVAFSAAVFPLLRWIPGTVFHSLAGLGAAMIAVVLVLICAGAMSNRQERATYLRIVASARSAVMARLG